MFSPLPPAFMQAQYKPRGLFGWDNQRKTVLKSVFLAVFLTVFRAGISKALQVKGMRRPNGKNGTRASTSKGRERPSMKWVAPAQVDVPLRQPKSCAAKIPPTGQIFFSSPD
jgi:hypothetical protein